MPRDPYGSGSASWSERARRVVKETIRQIKLEAKNDPNFVPLAEDASFLLAARHFVLPPAVPERPSNDANDVLASRVFSHTDNGGAGAGTPFNVPWTLVQRDALGNYAASTAQLVAIRGTTVGGYDFILYAPDGTTAILRVPTGTQNTELPNGSLKVFTGFGCNSKTPQTAVTSGAAAGNGAGGAGTVAGTAGAAYTATEQTIINDLVSTINAQAAIINALATQVTANATAANTMRTALIANGILV